MDPEIKAFIVDDEYQGRIILSKMLLQHLPEIRLVGEAETVEEAYEKINDLDPELVFLDIQMKNETGFELLKKFSKIQFNIIFTTAHNEYALKAFRFNAVDYLLKPLILSELVEAVEKVKNNLSSRQFFSTTQVSQLNEDIRNPKKHLDKITIPTSEGFIVLSIADIIYCEANGNYTEFHLLGNHKILSSYTLKQYHEILIDQHFLRVHRSYLINTTFIKEYKRSGGGIIIMTNGKEIELARQHKEEFLQLFAR